MNKLLCTLLLIFVHCMCNAQRLNYGVEIGYLNNRLAVNEYSSKSKNGFLIGGVIDLTNYIKNQIK